MGRLAGKVALITGAAKGIGAECARVFVAEGARVMVSDVDAAAGEAMVAELGEAARFVAHDVRSAADWARVVGQVEQAFGRLDILVNNAGIARPGTPESLDEADYREVIAVCVDSVVLGCREAIGAMRRAGGGAIVNLASISAIRGEPNQAAYSAAKGAVDAYSRTVAVYCAQAGLRIRCNAILPNGIATPMVVGMLDRIAARPEAFLTGMPSAANERGEPRDVAMLALYLASDEARWVNGQSIVLDNSAAATKGFVPAVDGSPAR